jgi:hypothetical protein
MVVMSIILALGRLRQEEQQLKTRLGYMMGLYPQKQTKFPTKQEVLNGTAKKKKIKSKK